MLHGKNSMEYFRCGHCKNLAPIYVEAAGALAESGSATRLADVDCTVHKAVCNKYGVKGYPTVMLFSEGKEPTKYTEAREKQAIVNFMKNAAGEAAAV
jgi:protein disulfide-isomerase-like protein